MQSSNKKSFEYGVSITPEKLPSSSKIPFIFRGDLKSAFDVLRQYSYDAAELQLCNPKSLDCDWIVPYCEANGFKISAIGTGLEFVQNKMSLTSPDVQLRKDAVARLKEHIDLAHAIKTENIIIGTIRGNAESGVSKEQYYGWLKESLAHACEYALKWDIKLVLEAINFYVMDYLHTVAEVCEMIDLVGAPNLKVHIDTHHMMLEEIDMLESIRRYGDKIGYVHFADNNRLYPSGGSIDFASVVQALKEVNYSGFIVLECAPFPDEHTAVSEGMRYLERIDNQAAV